MVNKQCIYWLVPIPPWPLQSLLQYCGTTLTKTNLCYLFHKTVSLEVVPPRSWLSLFQLILSVHILLGAFFNPVLRSVACNNVRIFISTNFTYPLKTTQLRCVQHFYCIGLIGLYIRRFASFPAYAVYILTMSILWTPDLSYIRPPLVRFSSALSMITC